ncbi:hypothetical protein AA0117_g3562 [Alternaria alternata]|uniref:Uncharacterized protein n=1 Tax=Alternaria alternata TaxID=5599 RepID=A0A4Q4NMS3_ALTAL|nr:hypothetical protein AA0117_g3562 [Alternaria alternata]
MSATTEQEQAPNVPTNNLNVKQQNRIRKRRLARQKLITHLALTRRNTTYIPGVYQGCIPRPPRGPDGRFLTPEQITVMQMEALEIQETKGKPTECPNEKPKL